MSQEDETLARDCVDLLFQNRLDEVEGLLDPAARNDETHENLAEMKSFFPSKPISVKPVEARVVHGQDFSTTSITLEYQFKRSWLLAYVVIQRKDGVRTITSFGITPTAEPIEVTNAFTFDDKGPPQYAGLLLALSVAVLTVYAFVLCVCMKIGGKKWVWLLAILTGVCRLTVNWTTGQWHFTPLAFLLPPVNVSCSAYGPWVLHIFSPVGAIAFLRLRKKLASEAVPLTIVPQAVEASGGSAQH